MDKVYPSTAVIEFSGWFGRLRMNPIMITTHFCNYYLQSFICVAEVALPAARRFP
jgi:hypothetical protein